MSGVPVLSPTEEASLLRLARWKIRPWEEHAEYEDMLSESYLAAWRSYCRGIELGPKKALSMATNAAGFGPTTWLRSWFGRTARGSARSSMEFVALSEADHLPAPGPEAAVLDRLEQVEARAVLAAGLEACTVRQREVLWRLFVLGQEQREVARAMGIGDRVVGKMRARGLENCRKARAARRTPPAEWGRYEVCRRGHPQIPENLLRLCRGGVFVATRCRLCAQEYTRSSRAKARQRGTAGQDGASGAGGTP